MELLHILTRTVISFMVLLIMARWLGKKQMSHLTFFNYITGITIGSVAANITLDPSIPFYSGLTSLVVWTALSVLMGYIGLKSWRARIILDGEPTIVIQHGQILEDAMAKIRLNMDDLSMLLREKDVHSIQDVDHAIFEPHGKLSVIKKIDMQNITKKDMHILTVQPNYVPTELIVDGEVVQKNLQELCLSQAWLDRQLQQHSLSLEEVFFAEIQSDGSLFIDKRGDKNSTCVTPKVGHP
ncbi:DUF421 domain-containing protein [Marininema halotolerans]|uniref:Uncharacterized membrane protein YcaP, DUF421 family n=1 Tax=Marininema halotolerans TaxID=1155944 RepID=A0A1I6R9F2_9BACL|nr:DUF421 domain-containing protein [Marininema halotolerans]SFS61349.1 Uncharacterized membrane protein YcaP, DUF421 family [Marininema halotolerans]